jgi:hypothetical protein
MQNLKLGSDSFDSDAADMLEGLQQQRSSVLGSLVDLHVGLGLLAGAEADRLAQKNGADDPRVQVLRDRSDAATARVDALSVEQEIAAVRTPAPSATGALIQGRVTDVTQRAAGQVSVQLVDQKGQAVPGVGSVAADDSGYFAIQLTPDNVKAIGGNKVGLLVRSGNDQLVPAAAQPLTVAAGAVLTQGVTLSAAELAQLRLRVPVAVGPVKIQPQPRGAPVADTDTAGSSAADKAAADKAAADKAAADDAAAKKAAADKAAADKAAADKTTKAAADKAPALKSRPTRPRGGKS